MCRAHRHGRRAMTEDKSRNSLDDLDAKLRKAQSAREPKAPPTERESMARGMSLAIRIGVDLVAALVIGVAVGYGLDVWLGTLPLFLIVFFVLGSAAGISNVFRTVGGYGAAVGYRKPAAGHDGSRAGAKDEDEEKN